MGVAVGAAARYAMGIRTRTRSELGNSHGGIPAVIVAVRGISIAALLAGLVVPRSCAAQHRGHIGIGAQVGRPAALSARTEIDDGPRLPAGARIEAVSILVALDFGRFFLAQTHIESNWTIPDSPIELYGGPGLVTVLDDASFQLGIGFAGGVRFYRGHYEIFIQAHPRLIALPSIRVFHGAGVGLRYYF